MKKIPTVFSVDRIYRYTLWREWKLPEKDLFYSSEENGRMFGNKEELVQFLALNPSTADEVKDDRTVRRCIDYAKRWGFGAMVMTNLFGFRSTDPTVMLNHPAPVGPENDAWLLKVAESAQLVICAWGNDGAHLSRSAYVVQMLRRKPQIKLSRLGPLTNLGHPRHPLYLRSDLVPVDF